MSKNPIGVLTEQGFPAGQFGFDKLNEQDQKKVKEDLKKPNKWSIRAEYSHSALLIVSQKGEN